MSDHPGARAEDVSALVGAVRSGEPSAIDAWFHGEHPVVYRLCYGLLANTAEAEDAAQDALVHLFERLDRWDPRRAYGAWRSRVVVNLCRDRLRRRAARAQAELAGATVELEHEAGPAQQAEQAELADMLRAALGALTPREREVFVLRDLEGVASAEAAQVLEVTESTVRSLLTLARRRLRALLGPRLLAGSADHGGEGV